MAATPISARCFSLRVSEIFQCSLCECRVLEFLGFFSFLKLCQCLGY